jgi:hypothetical protein
MIIISVLLRRRLRNSVVRNSVVECSRQDDVKKLILETWSNFGLEKMTPGCVISDRWGFGIHFGSDEISAKSIFSHLPDGVTPHCLALGVTPSRPGNAGHRFSIRLPESMAARFCHMRCDHGKTRSGRGLETVELDHWDH